MIRAVAASRAATWRALQAAIRQHAALRCTDERPVAAPTDDFSDAKVEVLKRIQEVLLATPQIQQSVITSFEEKCKEAATDGSTPPMLVEHAWTELRRIIIEQVNPAIPRAASAASSDAASDLKRGRSVTPDGTLKRNCSRT